MPLELITLRCLKDNYAYLLHGPEGTALIDAPESGPILSELQAQGWKLDVILLTHHHWDHIDAVPEIVAETGAKVIGAHADAHRLPPLDYAVKPGESINFLGEPAEILDVSGHTVGHIAFYFPQSQMAFTADSLMALGCGRLFEGDPAMMWESISRLNSLPADTLICSGHDYCTGNGAFALSVDPENGKLKERLSSTENGQTPCAPVKLELERATNPFLRTAQLREALGMENASDADVFAQLRKMKDEF